MGKRKLFLGLAALSLTTVGWAQTDSLPIGPGDQVHVLVFDVPELEEHARVLDDGEFPLILGGKVKLAGLLPDQAAALIEQALLEGNYVQHPHVHVTVDGYASKSVSIIGQVKLPGNYMISTPRPILDVLAIAGGLTDLANRTISIQRQGAADKIDYFVSNNAASAINNSVLIYPGDLIFVPKLDVVYILGDVGRPGGYAMATNDSKISILEAVAMAGSTPPNAVPSKTRLIRKMPDGSYMEIHIELSKMQKGKVSDIPLRPDDILFVPFSYLRNAFLGVTGLLSAASSAAIYRF